MVSSASLQIRTGGSGASVFNPKRMKLAEFDTEELVRRNEVEVDICGRGITKVGKSGIVIPSRSAYADFVLIVEQRAAFTELCNAFIDIFIMASYSSGELVTCKYLADSNSTESTESL